MSGSADVQGPLTADDRFAIFELFAHYGLCFDIGDVEGFLALFLPDAVYELSRGRRFEGHAQIRGYVEQAAASEWLPGRQHHVDQVILTGDCQRVSAHSYCTVTQRTSDGTLSLVYLGRYVDVCVKVDGIWRFQERIVRDWDPAEYRANQPVVRP